MIRLSETRAKREREARPVPQVPAKAPNHTCPYCKIDFRKCPWAAPRPKSHVVCRNCRWYWEANRPEEGITTQGPQ